MHICMKHLSIVLWKSYAATKKIQSSYHWFKKLEESAFKEETMPRPNAVYEDLLTQILVLNYNFFPYLTSYYIYNPRDFKYQAWHPLVVQGVCKNC